MLSRRVTCHRLFYSWIIATQARMRTKHTTPRLASPGRFFDLFRRTPGMRWGPPPTLERVLFLDKAAGMVRSHAVYVWLDCSFLLFPPWRFLVPPRWTMGHYERRAHARVRLYVIGFRTEGTRKHTLPAADWRGTRVGVVCRHP